MLLRIVLQIKSANAKVKGTTGKQSPLSREAGCWRESNYATRWTAGVWKGAPQRSQCLRMVASNVSNLTRTLKGTLLQMGRWGNGKRLCLFSRTGWLVLHFPLGLQRVVKWRFNTGLQSGDLGSVPVLPMIPYDPGWLGVVCRNFSVK